MAIISMKKVVFEVQPQQKEQLVEWLKNNEQFYAMDNPLVGFVKTSEVEGFCQSIQIENCTYHISEPSITDGDQPPVLLEGNFFTRPFIDSVKKHALPQYYDLDPTFLFALGFCVLFGIMFGDIGQGIILVLIGVFYKKSPSAGIFSRVGVFSILFGWLYGSIFGNEEIIGEFMEKHHFNYHHFELLAKENTEKLLLITITVGAILIILTMIVHIVDALREKRLKDIIADKNGVSGLLFYGSFFVLAFGKTYLEISGSLLWIVCIGCILISILMIVFLRKGRLIDRLAYLWDTVLESVSSTMAFLMVGCFALAHATLMYVVFTLAKLAPNFYWIIIVLGNILVMGIEATEVYHQCMHLCFRTLLPFITTEKKD